MSKELSIIVAVAENGVIGRNNDLIWHISEDLKRFKNLTTGHTIVMGRKTFESFPKGPLPNRRHVIITRDKTYTAESCEVVHSFEEALKNCNDSGENFIIGGGEIYRELLPFAGKIYLTKVLQDFEGDTYFPEIDSSVWETEEESEIKTDIKSGIKYQYVNLIRK